MKPIKIFDIFPDIYSKGVDAEMQDRTALSKELHDRTNGLIQLDFGCIEKGSDSIECFYDSAMAIPYILQKAKWAQNEGYDAVLLDCFMDPGLGECREYLTMPSFGVCQSACNLAVRLGGEFSVIGILDDMDRCIKENLRKYGICNMLTSIPVVDVPVLELNDNVDVIIPQIVAAGKKAVLEDGAKSLVFGCTGLSPLVNSVKAGLLAEGINVPVIEPLRAALYDAVSCVLMGVAHSKRAYCDVRSKRRMLDWE